MNSMIKSCYQSVFLSLQHAFHLFFFLIIHSLTFTETLQSTNACTNKSLSLLLLVFILSKQDQALIIC
jgi:hypothetical protein